MSLYDLVTSALAWVEVLVLIALIVVAFLVSFVTSNKHCLRQNMPHDEFAWSKAEDLNERD